MVSPFVRKPGFGWAVMTSSPGLAGEAKAAEVVVVGTASNDRW